MRSKMEKKYNPMEYNNAIACEVCGGLNYADDYGNSAKCPHCGWQQCGSNETEEKWHGISYRRVSLAITNNFCGQYDG